MARLLRILHAIPFLWSGAGAVVTRLCESQRVEHDVHLVTSHAVDGLSDWSSYRQRLKAAKVEHHRVNLFSRSPERFWPAVDGLAALIQRLRPDIVHAHAGTPTLAAALACRLAGRDVPVVGQMYSWGSSRPGWMDEMDATGFGLADQVVVSARAYGRRLADLGVPPTLIRYVPWGLPIEALDQVAARSPTRQGGPRIGFVGRIEPRKRQLELARAFDWLVRRFPSARLELVGPIADVSYANQVGAVGADGDGGGRIRLTGMVHDPWTFVRRWDLFVSLSADEGQGLAILEAMALGVPVLAVAASGVEDYLIEGRTGLVLRGREPDAVGFEIASALSRPDRLAAIAARARRIVSRRYDWSRTIETFDAIYTALTNDRHKPRRPAAGSHQSGTTQPRR